jgi:putative transcriptional regulator
MSDLGLTLEECLTGTLLLSVPGKPSATHPLEECIIYIYEHTTELGAQGVVINRHSELTVDTLLERMDYTADSLSLRAPLYHGGHTEENGVIMVHTSEWYSSNTRPVTNEVSVSSDTFMLEKLIAGNEPDDWLMCAGKCTWEPGHLELEVMNKQWLTLPAANNIVFSSATGEKQWRKALDTCSRQAVDRWF